MAKRKFQHNNNLLYLGGGFTKSECGKGVLEYNNYKCYSKHFSYDNFYIANKEITGYIFDNEIKIIVSEGLSCFFTLFVSNENTAPEYPMISRIFINPLLKPSEDLLSLGVDESIANTYKTMETNVHCQKYLDIRHSFCIFSEDNHAIKYANDFTKITGIKSIVINHIDDEFIQTTLHNFVNELNAGKDVNFFLKS